MMLTSKEEQPRGFDELTVAARKSGAQVQTKIYDQSGIHGTNMFGKVTGVEELIAAFLKENMS